MAVRRDNDNYETPAWVVNALLDNHLMPLGKYLEPCAGSGAIISALQKRLRCLRLDITAVEIRQEEYGKLAESANAVHIDDFLTWRPSDEFDVIITNPPYSMARQIIERALEIANGQAEVIMLLRLSFLASAERFPFWREHRLSKLLVLRDRPSFIGGGSDNSEYAWFIWNSGPGQAIETIYSDTRPRKRKAGEPDA